MSFYTALTGLNAATSQLGVTSNNIANVSTVGFKRSRTDFGDIFATSPLQKASSTIGQGVSLKQVSQEFSQGNMVTTSNTLDLAISGDGFFHLKSQDGFQDIFTRNGVFMLNDQYNVVNSAGQKLIAASVDSSGKANLNDMNVLTIPQRTNGMAKQTSSISLGLNLPSDAPVITKAFDRTDPTTYNKSTALTVYDAGGNSYLASIYYVKTQDASSDKPTNKWQTYAFIGDQLVGAALQQVTTNSGDLMYVNKYGQLRAASDFTSAADQAALMSSFAKKTEKFLLNDLSDKRTSVPASVNSGSAVSGMGTGSSDGVNMKNYSALSKVDLLMQQGSESVTYNLATDVKADTYTISMAGMTNPVSVTTVDSVAPTLADVVNKLNSDATFAGKYVAQATTTVKISGVGAITDPSYLSTMNIMLGGKQATITNIVAASSSLKDIAAKLQERLRSYDGGKSNLSVKLSQNGSDIEITDSLGREISGISLNLTDAGAAALLGITHLDDATSGSGELEIAAIDPSVDGASIEKDISIVKTVSGDPKTIAGTVNVTDYPRVTANYVMTPTNADATTATYSVQVGSGADAPTLTSETLSGLVTKLKNNSTFAAEYDVNYLAATAPDIGGVLSVTAKNPATSYASITQGLKVTINPMSVDPATKVSTALAVETSPVSRQTAAMYATGLTFPSNTTPLEVVITNAAHPTGTTIDLTTLTPQPTTIEELVTALNSDSDFNLDYKAMVADGKLKIMSRHPSQNGTDVADEVVVKIGANIPDVAHNAPQDLWTDSAAGVEIASDLANLRSADELRDLFSINVDNSKSPISVGLSYLAGKNITLSGSQIAQELTNQINRAYGDEKPFNFYGTGSKTFSLQLDIGSGSGNTTSKVLDFDLANAGDADRNMRYEDMVAAVQAQIDSDAVYAGRLTASYDTQAQKLIFTPTSVNDKVTILASTNALGLTDQIAQAADADSVGVTIAPNVSTNSYRASSDQRYGINVTYDGVSGKFVFNSGTTGDTSSIAITGIKPNSFATQTSKGLGMTGAESNYAVSKSAVDAIRGITSKPAILTGNAMSINADNNFPVDATNNTFVVSVNGVTGTVTIPPKDNYTIDTFTAALQNGINSLQGPSTNGLTPQTIDGVKVAYDATKNALIFTTGTASSDSYIKVIGNSKWGLSNLKDQFGSTSTWIKPTQSKDASGASIYIDSLGKETTSATGFNTLPEWSPIYLKKGELTFDTSGNLVSPKQGSQLDTVYLPNGKGALTINIDYSKSTQFASSFSVLSQSQDGSPEGDLVSLAIKEDGLVQASYSNGSDKSLAKIVLANFSNPSGLRQIGDTNYYATTASGSVKYGEAGSAGYGTTRSGATERANVDLTQELVDLITEQRNFQASAKAMETDTQMTQTIIQIRN
ncbi:MAG: Flagellar hook protein FlgE [Pseudomonadota bacterium]